MYTATHPTITALVTAWHEAGRASYATAYPASYATGVYDRTEVKRAKDRRKYVAMDDGSSGAFLVEKQTGEVYGIKGYGVPHLGKHYGHVEQLTGHALQVARGHSYYRQGCPMPDITPVPVTEAPAVPSGPRTIDLKTTAAMLRAELKQRYPGVKFSVRGESYSMGCSITVSWQDGPTEKQLAPLFAHFQGERFDGSDDSRHAVTTEHAGEQVRFAADHVHGTRTYSRALLGQCAQRVCDEYSVRMPETKEGSVTAYVESTEHTHDDAGQQWAVKELVYQRACATSALPKPRIRLMPTVTPCAV